MKIKVGSFAVVLCGSLLLFAAARAQAQVGNRFYFKADIGGNWTQDADLREFFGEPLTAGAKVKFDPGLRLGFTTGFRVTEWFSPEVETGIMASEIKSISGSSSSDAWFYNVPLMFNIRLQPPHMYTVVPYVGIGTGVSFPSIDVDRISIGNTSIFDGSDSDAVWAYQAFAGLRFKINENMGISVEYRYFHADSAQWEADFATGSEKFRFGQTETHCVSLAFDFRF